jgi:hypothetical protein
MKKLYLIIVGFLLLISCSDDTGTAPGKVGWAIGWDQNETAVILNTIDSGQTWKIQGAGLNGKGSVAMISAPWMISPRGPRWALWTSLRG